MPEGLGDSERRKSEKKRGNENCDETKTNLSGIGPGFPFPFGPPTGGAFMLTLGLFPPGLCPYAIFAARLYIDVCLSMPGSHLGGGLASMLTRLEIERGC